MVEHGARQPAAQRPDSALRRLGRGLGTYGVYIVFPLAVVVLWEGVALAGIYRRTTLPGPGDVLVVWYDLLTGTLDVAGRYTGTWWRHAFASVWRVYAGFAWGAGLGVLVGLFIGLSRAIEKMVDPTVQVLRNIPVTAWIPLSLIFFGIGNKPAIFLIGLGAFFPTVVNTTHGVRQGSQTLHKAALMLGANRRELLWRVILPGALPSILTGLRLSMGIAWVLVVVAEVLAVRSGLGYLLNDAYLFYRNDVVIATMLSIGLLGFLSDRLMVLLRDHILEWNRLETYGG